VPSGNILHEADAPALHGIGKNHHRLVLDGSSDGKGLHQLLHIVAVDAQHLPAKGGVFCGQRLHLHYILHPAVNLQPIDVNDGDDIVELVVAGLHRRLPNLPLLLLAVAHQAEDLVRFLVEPRGQRHAHGDAQALAQRTGGDLDSGQLQPMRMPLKARVQLAQRHHIVDLAEAGEAQADIERRRLVPSRPDNAVAIRPERIFGIVTGSMKIERGGDVHDGERAAGVPGAGRT
jgi:hypothetical protein